MRIPWVVCGWSSSHIFCQKRVRNSSGRQKSACKLLNNLLILISCFIASEVPSLGMGRHHILSFEELFPQISSFDMIFESTPHWMSQFWKQLIPFFRKKTVFDALSPRTALPITISLSQLSHSTNRNFIASSASSSKYICERKVIDLTESSIFFYVAHTYAYRSFVVFKQRKWLFWFFL